MRQRIIRENVYTGLSLEFRGGASRDGGAGVSRAIIKRAYVSTGGAWWTLTSPIPTQRSK